MSETESSKESSASSHDAGRERRRSRLMIYGAYGYSGELIARRAVERGLRPLLAGRRPQPLEELAEELDLEWEAFQLERPEIVRRRLAEVDAVLHCAGPFLHTFRPVAEACLETGTHYLDITGEFDVFETLSVRGEEAREAGVVFLPGVGFDVVPSDCLLLYVAQQVPEATHLTLALEGLRHTSRGTAITMAENIGRAGRVRRDGRLTKVPPAWKTREVTFRDGERQFRRTVVTVPWGDIATAFRSTGVPNIEVYAALSGVQRFGLWSTRWLGGVLASRPAQAVIKGRLRSRRPGPTEAQRRRGRCRLWAEARSAGGERAEAWMSTPEGYTVTADAAVAVAERVLAGDVEPGFTTPAKAFGADFALELDGVERWESAS